MVAVQKAHAEKLLRENLIGHIGGETAKFSVLCRIEQRLTAGNVQPEAIQFVLSRDAIYVLAVLEKHFGVLVQEQANFTGIHIFGVEIGIWIVFQLYPQIAPQPGQAGVIFGDENIIFRFFFRGSGFRGKGGWFRADRRHGFRLNGQGSAWHGAFLHRSGCTTGQKQSENQKNSEVFHGAPSLSGKWFV